MDASVGLVIQCVGIVLVTLLSFFIMRSIRSRALRYWTVAWTCLSAALASLIVAFHWGTWTRPGYACYFLGEYLFGFMFTAGCREQAAGRPLARRDFLWLAPLAALAASLPFLSDDFNNLFMAQAAVMAAFFAAALWQLRPAWRGAAASPGVRVMSVALALLAVNFAHYVPVFGARSGIWGYIVPAAYLKYTSIFDLILEILLGFGTVMVLMEGVRREVEAANRELTAARDRLELMARVDPLTQAFNRHAFHSLLARADAPGNDAGGCVVVIDIDNLKPINDTHGHAAGDEAIRAVASAVRALVRADDMLFRWGGDEFLLLLFGLPEPEARKRMEFLNTPLAETRLQRVAAPVAITVSYGLAGFATLADLQQGIEQADSAMYRRKQDAKAQRTRPTT
ncbi:MAG TPA: GGDEF domain-containing protein [Pyrinomonadaceae bacterium]|jgi:diguanylate cyclase (GGDEF)-like protein